MEQSFSTDMNEGNLLVNSFVSKLGLRNTAAYVREYDTRIIQTREYCCLKYDTDRLATANTLSQSLQGYLSLQQRMLIFV